MKKKLFPLILLFIGSSLSAQQDVFALTGKKTPSIQFNDFRTLDVTHGKSGDIIFGVDSQAKVFSQAKKSIITEDKNALGNSQSTSLAALALELKTQNLVYMPMYSSNIYVYNPKTKQTQLIENNIARVSTCDINSHITRMATGYDGHIYALNNSGTQFLQISKKGEEYSVKDLGIIQDDVSNGKNSFTSIETGFGGDMIVDAENNFYVFASSGNIFKIDIRELRAKFIGKISGLPENYSVNGAAVNSTGKITIASAKGDSLYEVNMQNLWATKIAGDSDFHIYDLASPYFYNDKVVKQELASQVDIYPTRLENGILNIKLNDKASKFNIKINVFDGAGKNVYSQQLKTNDRVVDLKELVSGMYIVTLTEESGNILLSKKIIVSK